MLIFYLQDEINGKEATPTNNLSQNEDHQSENLKEVPSETANENVVYDFTDEEVMLHLVFF